MRRKKQPFTTEDAEYNEQRIAISERRTRLFTHFYRQSNFFKIAWGIRIFYFFFFLILLPVCSFFTYNHKEVITDVNHMVFSAKGQIFGGTHKYLTLVLTTNDNEYTCDVSHQGSPNLYIGDTVLIMKNIFGKAVYFSKAEWQNKYLITGNLIYYIVSHFVILITCFFNEGDFFSIKIQRFSILMSCIVTLLYLLFS